MSSVPIPSKGDIVTIENKQYRVLKVTDKIVELLSFDDSRAVKFNSSQALVTFTNGVDGARYYSTLLSNMVTTIFNELPENIKQAVVQKNVVQDMLQNSTTEAPTTGYYVFNSPTTTVYFTKYPIGIYNLGLRDAYVLTFSDIIDYLNLEEGNAFSYADIINMFHGNLTPSTAYDNTFLMTSLYDGSPVYRVFNNGNVNWRTYQTYGKVQIAFQVNWDILYPSTPQPTLTFKHLYDAGTIGSGTVKFRHYSQTEPIPQLATPQNVSASGTTVSWDAVENATSYEILVNNSSFGTVSTTSVDLSTLSGWASLTDGEYSVTIVAKADGYRDSEPSAAVSVTKQGGGGKVIKAGTYKWVDTPDIRGITDIIGDFGGFDGQFKSSDITFDFFEFSVGWNKITYNPSENFTSLIGGEEVDECGYLDGQWGVKQPSGEITDVPALQTLTILEDIDLTSVWNDTEIEQAILTWFTANTTKLS